MEEDDDDFYGSGEAHQGSAAHIKDEDDGEIKPDKMDVSADEGEESEDDDSDDDFQITLEKPDGAKPTPPTSAAAKHLLRQQPTRTASGSSAADPTSTKSGPGGARSASVQPKSESTPRPGTTPAPAATALKGVLTHHGREGREYPEVRTSGVDVDANPLWPGGGGGEAGAGPAKPILEVDIDADLALHSKPWRLPGTDQTDFFNYGFDEYTWTQYCVRQQTMAGTIAQQKDSDAQMKAFFGGGGGMPGAPGGGGGPGGPPGGGMPGMPPGMPDPAQMMEMVNQGVIPPEFAQMMQMGGGMPPFGGPGGGGGPQNSASPQPQGGFQPPTGPSGGGGGQQGFPGGGPGMEGYSAQQMAIMQQEHQGGGGGGGGRGRRRGRGYY